MDVKETSSKNVFCTYLVVESLVLTSISYENLISDFRSQAMGLFYVCSQLGGGLAPWISKGLLRFHFTLPLFVLGGFPVCCFFLALTLRETKGRNIDSQGLYRTESCFFILFTL